MISCQKWVFLNFENKPDAPEGCRLPELASQSLISKEINLLNIEAAEISLWSWVTTPETEFEMHSYRSRAWPCLLAIGVRGMTFSEAVFKWSERWVVKVEMSGPPVHMCVSFTMSVRGSVLVWTILKQRPNSVIARILSLPLLTIFSHALMKYR